MKSKFSSSHKSLEIFSQSVTPIKNYIIKGDKKPEREFRPIYLRKMSSKFKPDFIYKNTPILKK